MNAVAIAELESGRAIGFFCATCGRNQLPLYCQNPLTVEQLTELHRKAEACCTTRVCPKHEYITYDWHLCPYCVQEGPVTDIKSGENYTEPMRHGALEFADGNRLAATSSTKNAAKRARKAAAR